MNGFVPGIIRGASLRASFPAHSKMWFTFTTSAVRTPAISSVWKKNYTPLGLHIKMQDGLNCPRRLLFTRAFVFRGEADFKGISISLVFVSWLPRAAGLHALTVNVPVVLAGDFKVHV